MVADLTPRAASARLSLALMHLDIISPPSLRKPVSVVLRAGIEVCAMAGTTLIGQHVGHALLMADAILSEVDRTARD